MNRTILIAPMTALAVLPGVATAQQGSGDRTAAAKQVAPNVTEFDKQMAQAQENMKKMQEQMDKIRQTQDPQVRQKLLNEHWTTMQGNMQMMHGMGSPGMMGCCASDHMMGKGGHMMGGMMGWQGYSKLKPEQMKQRQYMMDRYMGMQQMMMDHMMQHQQYMWQR